MSLFFASWHILYLCLYCLNNIKNAVQAGNSTKALKKKQWQVEQQKLVYQNCIHDTDQAYANQCQQLVEQNQRNIENCLNAPRVKYHSFKGEAYCVDQFGDDVLSVDCDLSIEIADRLERIRA